MVRSHAIAAKLGGYTNYSLFLDIAQAFYKVIRQQAFECSFSDEDVLVFLKRMGVEDMCLEDVAAVLEGGSTLTNSQCDPFLHSQVAEVHRSMWFVLNQDPTATLVHTERGTRPGDGFADIIWSLVFARWARRFEERLFAWRVDHPIHLEWRSWSSNPQVAPLLSPMLWLFGLMTWWYLVKTHKLTGRPWSSSTPAS